MNRNSDVKRLKTWKYCLPKYIIKKYNFIINGKKNYGQAIDSDIKRYDEIRKLTTGTTGQVEDYTTGCLFGYEYIRNHYRLIAVDLGRQKELDADPKATQETIFGHLKKTRW